MRFHSCWWNHHIFWLMSPLFGQCQNFVGSILNFSWLNPSLVMFKKFFFWLAKWISKWGIPKSPWLFQDLNVIPLGWFGHTQQHVNYSLAVKHYHRTDTMGEIKRLRPRWKKGYGRVNQRLVVADHHNNTANMWRALWKLYEHIVGDGSKIKWNIVQPRKDSLHKNMLNWSRRERVCMCM